MTIRTAFHRLLIWSVLLASPLAVACGQNRTEPAATDAAAETKPAAGQAAADVTASDTSVDVGQVRVMLLVAQRPITPLAKERFCVRAEIDGIPADLAKGHLTFDTSTPTGEHRYPLADSGDGCQSADVVLPTTPDGRRWFVTVEGVVDEQPVTARFQFDVAPAPATP